MKRISTANTYYVRKMWITVVFGLFSKFKIINKYCDVELHQKVILSQSFAVKRIFEDMLLVYYIIVFAVQRGGGEGIVS